MSLCFPRMALVKGLLDMAADGWDEDDSWDDDRYFLGIELVMILAFPKECRLFRGCGFAVLEEVGPVGLVAKRDGSDGRSDAYGFGVLFRSVDEFCCALCCI